MYSTAYNLWTFTWFVHFKLPFRLKGTEKIHTERFSKFHSNIYSILYGCISVYSILLRALYILIFSILLTALYICVLHTTESSVNLYTPYRALHIWILHTTESSVYLYTPYFWKLCVSVYSILLKTLYICILHTTESSVYLYTPYY